MKKLIISIAISLLFSCSKQTEPLRPVEKSVTYLNHYYNSNWELQYSDTAIHWCRVSGEELKRFEAIETTTEGICDTYNKMELVIAKPCSPNRE